MHARERRLAENESVFRAVNEQVGRIAERFGDERHVYEFFCECSRWDCQARLELSAHEYAAVREHPARFLVLPGHETPEVEEVVERYRGYDVVEKRGEAAALVAAYDTRSRA